MSSDTYWRSVEHDKKGNMEIYKECLKKVFGKEISWKEFKEADNDDQIEVMCALDDGIRIKKSPIDIEKMTRAILYSRSGIGGSAMTRYTCAFCGADDIWGNTAVPKICHSCARKMATKITMYHYNVLKDGEQKLT